MAEETGQNTEFIDTKKIFSPERLLFLASSFLNLCLNFLVVFSDFRYKWYFFALLLLNLLVILYVSKPFSFQYPNIIPLSPSVPNEVSLQIAQNRSKKFNDLNNNLGILETPKRAKGEFVDSDEFFEIPENDITAYRNLQRWYMKSPELLLAERVIDGIWFLYREHQLRKKGVQFPTIKLSHDNYNESNTFPYEIVIQTASISLYQSILTPYLDWFGIRILLQYQTTSASYFGSCIEKGGLQGITGGGIRNSSGTFPVTCAHVVSGICNNTMLKSIPGFTGINPDLAIFKNDSPCFYIRNKRERTIPVATKNDIDLMIKEKHSVNKIYPNKNRARKGMIDCRIMAFEIEGNFHRFPHLCILPKFIDRGLFLTPFFGKRFSRRGDSGSWIINTRSGWWIGMVIGGRPKPFYLTYVAEAEPLIEFISGKLNSTIEPVTF